jgi:hypothetical protein
MRIYISGKISGLPIETAVEIFERAENFLKEHGLEVFNPLKDVDLDKTYAEHTRTDIRALLDCEVIYMLKGYHWSSGAMLELDVARACGIRAVYEGFESVKTLLNELKA